MPRQTISVIVPKVAAGFKRKERLEGPAEF